MQEKFEEEKKHFLWKTKDKSIWPGHLFRRVYLTCIEWTRSFYCVNGIQHLFPCCVSLLENVIFIWTSWACLPHALVLFNPPLSMIWTYKTCNYFPRNFPRNCIKFQIISVKNCFFPAIHRKLFIDRFSADWGCARK